MFVSFVNFSALFVSFVNPLLKDADFFHWFRIKVVNKFNLDKLGGLQIYEKLWLFLMFETEHQGISIAHSYSTLFFYLW